MINSKVYYSILFELRVSDMTRLLAFFFILLSFLRVLSLTMGMMAALLTTTPTPRGTVKSSIVFF